MLNLIGTGAAHGGAFGALWGTLIGLLFLNPLAGFLVGTATGAGALSGALGDYGIDDNFIESLGSTISPRISAIFLPSRSPCRPIGTGGRKGAPRPRDQSRLKR